MEGVGFDNTIGPDSDIIVPGMDCIWLNGSFFDVGLGKYHRESIFDSIFDKLQGGHLAPEAGVKHGMSRSLVIGVVHEASYYDCTLFFSLGR